MFRRAQQYLGRLGRRGVLPTRRSRNVDQSGFTRGESKRPRSNERTGWLVLVHLLLGSGLHSYSEYMQVSKSLQH